MFTDLIYDPEAREIIKTKFPKASFKDADGTFGLREGRFEVDIPDITNDEFYPWFLTTGYAGSSFCFMLMAQGMSKEHCDNVRKWLDKAKELKGIQT
jgi:hypothetical protein